MNITLCEEDRSEILRYLGYRGNEITEVVEENIKAAIALSNKCIAVKYVWKPFTLLKEKEGLTLEGSDMVLKGKSIARHLKKSTRIILFCVTIGSEFDREIQKQMVKNPSLGVILNACGIQAVEKAADAVQKEAEESLECKSGVRFSPGYGDLPLETQEDVMRILDAAKLCGVTINESFLMNPQKSVTAIAGLED